MVAPFNDTTRNVSNKPLVITNGAPINSAYGDGQHAIDPATGLIYGPKGAGTWPSVPSGTLSPQKFFRMFGRAAALPSPPFATRPGAMQSMNTSAGMSTRLVVKAIYAVSSLQITYAGFSLFPDTETAGNNLVACSVEYPSGTYYKGHFDGESLTFFGTIPKGKTLTSKPISVTIPAGAIFYVNSTVVPSSGGNYPVGGGGLGATAFAGIDTCTTNSATDFTMTPQTAPTASDTYCFAPLCITGVPVGGNLNVPVVGGVGDSIIQGVGGQNNPSGGLDGGFLQQACQAAGIGYVNLGANGATVATAMFNPASRQHTRDICASATDVIINFGTNDLYNSQPAATVIANLTALVADIANLGPKVWVCTIPPRTTGTFTTVAGQAPYNAFFGPEVTGGSPWSIVNAAIRAGLPGATGVIDYSALISVLNTANNSYVFIPNGTQDGTHPVASLIQGAIPVAKFG